MDLSIFNKRVRNLDFPICRESIYGFCSGFSSIQYLLFLFSGVFILITDINHVAVSETERIFSLLVINLISMILKDRTHYFPCNESHLCSPRGRGSLFGHICHHASSLTIPVCPNSSESKLTHIPWVFRPLLLTTCHWPDTPVSVWSWLPLLPSSLAAFLVPHPHCPWQQSADESPCLQPPTIHTTHSKATGQTFVSVRTASRSYLPLIRIH